MPKINRSLLYDERAKLYCSGNGEWHGLNCWNGTGYSDEDVRAVMQSGFRNRNWKFVRIGEDGKITKIE